MYLGEPELQAKRRTLAVLMDESRKVLDSIRSLSLYYDALVKENDDDAKKYQEEIQNSLIEVQSFRRALTRQLAEMGSMLLNREDLLRAAYALEELGSYTESIAFRLGQIDLIFLKKSGFDSCIGDLLDLLIQSVSKTNETVRALQLNPAKVHDLVALVEKIERDFDLKYRDYIVKAIREIPDIKDLILIKDVLERLELVSDLSLKVADAILIIAIGL